MAELAETVFLHLQNSVSSLARSLTPGRFLSIGLPGVIDRKTLKMAWALLDKREKRQAWGVLAVVVFSALSASVMVASIMPFLSVLSEPERIHESRIFSRIYDFGGFETDRGFLFALGFTSIGIICIANLVQVLRVHVVTRFALMRAHTISYRLLSSFLRQPYAYFLVHHTGEMGTRVLSETQQIVVQFFKPAAEGFAALFTVIALLALLLWVNPVISLLTIGVFAVIYGGTLLATRRLVDRLGKIRTQANTDRFKIANEALGGVKDIKLLGREATYLDKFALPSERMARGQARVAVLSQTPQYVMQATVFAGLIVLCLVLLGDNSAAGRNTMADVLPTIGLMALAGQRMIPELSKLFRSITMLTYGDAAVRAVYEDMIRNRGTDELPTGTITPLGMKSELVFENVFYRYGEGAAGLSDVSLRIRAGERIGVVGTTGAGKSTLANILLGLIFPTEGAFIVDGTPVTPGNIRNWQRSLGYVPQEIFLIDASVRENIALGVPASQIDHERVEKAARIARIHDFILSELDQGYDTEVGERGVRLSGGQRQRIGIARALYNDGDLIVFDEATSALDNVTETEVMRSIEDLPGDKTLVMIAHRLSTLRSCDRILVLDRGRISAFAPWDELERDNRVFQDLSAGASSPTRVAEEAVS